MISSYTPAPKDAMLFSAFKISHPNRVARHFPYLNLRHYLVEWDLYQHLTEVFSDSVEIIDAHENTIDNKKELDMSILTYASTQLKIFDYYIGYDNEDMKMPDINKSVLHLLIYLDKRQFKFPYWIVKRDFFSKINLDIPIDKLIDYLHHNRRVKRLDKFAKSEDIDTCDFFCVVCQDEKVNTLKAVKTCNCKDVDICNSDVCGMNLSGKKCPYNNNHESSCGGDYELATINRDIVFNYNNQTFRHTLDIDKEYEADHNDLYIVYFNTTERIFYQTEFQIATFGDIVLGHDEELHYSIERFTDITISHLLPDEDKDMFGSEIMMDALIKEIHQNGPVRFVSLLNSRGQFYYTRLMKYIYMSLSYSDLVNCNLSFGWGVIEKLYHPEDYEYSTNSSSYDPIILFLRYAEDECFDEDCFKKEWDELVDNPSDSFFEDVDLAIQLT